MQFVSTATTVTGKPRKIPKKTSDMCYDSFMERGFSNHSRHGLLLAGLLNRLVTEKVKFTLIHEDFGYLLIKGIPDMPTL